MSLFLGSTCAGQGAGGVCGSSRLCGMTGEGAGGGDRATMEAAARGVVAGVDVAIAVRIRGERIRFFDPLVRPIRANDSLALPLAPPSSLWAAAGVLPPPPVGAGVALFAAGGGGSRSPRPPTGRNFLPPPADAGGGVCWIWRGCGRDGRSRCGFYLPMGGGGATWWSGRRRRLNDCRLASPPPAVYRRGDGGRRGSWWDGDGCWQANKDCRSASLSSS